MIKRLFDIVLAVFLMILFGLPMLLIAVFIRLRSKGPALFWTNRVGINNKIFKMAKFRTMKVDTPQLATHLMKDPKAYLIPGGAFLRKSSLDELPQLINVLNGDMSFVGPRPHALATTVDGLALEEVVPVYPSRHRVKPGITGWAQVNGRDDLPIPVKVSFDDYYLQHRTFRLDLYILFLTALKVIKKEGVSH